MTLKDVLDRCSCVASYAGMEVTVVNQRNIFGDTPLHVVSTWDELEPVAVLLAHGASVNEVGERGQTALFAAIIGGNLKVVQALLEHGADSSIRDDDGMTPLQFARARGLSEIVELLQRPPRRPS